MKKHYTLFARLILLGTSLLSGTTAVAQTIPDTQWIKLGANITALPDGNLLASLDGLPIGGVTGSGIAKYTLDGNLIWRRVVYGATFVGRAPFNAFSVYESISNVAATTNNIAIFGTDFGTGWGIYTLFDNDGKVTSSSESGQANYTPSGRRQFDDLIGTSDGGFLAVKDATVYKFTAQGSLTWTKSIGFPNPNPGEFDPSITKAQAVIKAVDGGYILVGYYSPTGAIPNNPYYPEQPPINPLTSQATGWITKINDNGEIVWQKTPAIPLEFVNGNLAPGALIGVKTFTDVMVTPDGTGYTLAGAGVAPSSPTPSTPVLCLVELTSDGLFKRGRLNGLAPNKAFITPYSVGNTTYYAIGTTSLDNGTNPLLALIHPAELSKIVTQRTFDSPSNSNLQALTTLSDGSLGFSTSKEIYKLNVDVTPPTGLIIQPPTYDCTTGQLSLNVSGATNTPIEYRVAGLRDWGASPVFTVPSYQRVGTTFTLQARQNGQAVSAPFVSNCVSVTVIPTGDLTLLPPLYDCNTGQLTLQVSAISNNLEYRVAGLRDWGPSPVFSVPSYQRVGTTFTLQARIVNGASTLLPFTSACGISTPISSTTDLTFSKPTLNCNNDGSAQLQINLVGISALANPGIEYKVPGLANWQAWNYFRVPSYQTQGTTFVLYARRVNTQAEFTTQFTANCPVSTRQGVPEPSSQLTAIVHPNPVGEQFTVEVDGAGQQTVRFELANLQGRLVQTRQVAVEAAQHQETFNLSETAAGLYFLRVATQHQTVIVKVLKP